MNFKKTWNRSEGFTLVELIVVIAILAILAGVAVPAYSGYIKKAEKAADLQLLGAVNTAFAAAALENGDDVSVDVTSASMPLTGTEGAMKVNADGIEPAAYREAFKRYYAGNTDSVFKVITSLRFENGAFVDGEGVTISYGGGTITLTGAQLAVLKQSTFNARGEEGVLELLNKVDTMAGLASTFDSQTMTNLMADGTFLKSVVASLGGDPNAEDVFSEYAALSTPIIEEAIRKELGVETLTNEIRLSDEYLALENKYSSEFSQNSAVLFFAQNASGTSTDAVMNIINSENPKQTILNSMTNPDTTASGVGNAAVVYGAFTAYANSASSNASADALAAVNANNPVSVFDFLTQNPQELANFQAYLGTTQGKTDLDATISAMQVISDASKDGDALSSVLLNGFNDTELVDLMNQVLGN